MFYICINYPLEILIFFCKDMVLRETLLYITLKMILNRITVQFRCSVVSNSLLHGLHMPGLPVQHQLLELTQTHVHWVGDGSNHLILCHPLLLLPAIFPSIRIFSDESILRIRWPKFWSFAISISPSNEYSGLISFWKDWLALLAVQGTLKSLFQHHSSKASVLQCSVFFIVQLSHPYMTTGKAIALTRWTFVGKVMSLLFNMLVVHNFSSKE